MNGVDILSGTTVPISFGPNWLVFFIVTFVFTILFGLLWWLVVAQTETTIKDILFSLSVGLLIGLFFGFAISTSDNIQTPREYEFHYKVIVSDEVSMNEFLEKYEIIEQDGKIYTVKERKK